MNRAVMLVAVTYTLALAIWTIGRLALGDMAQSTGLIATGAVLITQSIISAVITPWLACDASQRMPNGLLPLLTTPWPLLLFAVMISGIPTTKMMASQVCIGGLIILSFYSARGLLRILREGQLRTIALTVLQLVPAIVLWTGHNAWIPWFTS